MMFVLSDPVGNLLRRAAYLVDGPDSYDRISSASARNPDTAVFTATGFLERANLKGTQSGIAPLKPRGEPEVLQEAKARICRAVGAVHIDAWEYDCKPDWQEVRRVIEEAG